MAETALRQRFPQHSDAVGPARVRRRRPLPGGRAVVGGLLVAVSAVGIFAGYLGATADDTRTYVVAASDLAVGHRVTGADLAQVRLELPPALARLAYGRPAALEGAVVLGPVGRGELLQHSDVLVGATTTGAGQEISFPIEAARAVDGQLRVGELIDVLSTYGSGTDAYTVVIARGARIANRSSPEGGLAGSGEQVVTLAVSDAQTTLALAHAVNAGTLTLVRGAAPPGATAASGGGGYATPGPAPGAPGPATRLPADQPTETIGSPPAP